MNTSIYSHTETLTASSVKLTVDVDDVDGFGQTRKL